MPTAGSCCRRAGSSPFGMCQTTPSASRRRVVRRLTPSTVPDATPVSITSPTPYWSSMIMKIPERKSFTSDCAPKPTATPMMLAPMPIAARFTSSVSRTITSAVAQISAATMLRSTAPIVSARSARRMFGTGEVSSSDTPVRRRSLSIASRRAVAAEPVHDAPDQQPARCGPSRYATRRMTSDAERLRRGRRRSRRRRALPVMSWTVEQSHACLPGGPQALISSA